MHAFRRESRLAVSALVCLAQASCGLPQAVFDDSAPKLGTTKPVTGFIGAVAADEPRAARVGQDILAQNGSAADAAAAIGLALAVTLPSRAGLGGGGGCLVFTPGTTGPNRGAAEAVMFFPRPPRSRAGDRPAAVPMLARGLLALQARYGVLPAQRIIVPAEQLARLGTQVSKSLADDLAVVDGALIADPAAAQVFGPSGQVLGEGEELVQRDLGATLAAIRVRGIADLYAGDLARALVSGSAAAGGPMTAADLAESIPRLAAPIVLPRQKEQVAFLPPPADGGLAAAGAFQVLEVGTPDTDAARARALGLASAWRAGGNADKLLADPKTPDSTIGALPASTSFVTIDRAGNAVACALTMGNLFGTGRVAPGTGILLAASPSGVPSPLLAAAIAWTRSSHAFRAAIAGSGQEGAPVGVAYGMIRTLTAKTAMPATVPSPGHINAIACPRGLPGDSDQCTWATDPRGAGLAVGAN